MAPLSPPLPATMARDLPREHEALPEFSTASPSRRFVSTSSPADSFYTTLDGIYGLIVQMHIRFHHGQELGSNTKEYVHLIGDVLAKCDHIEWKVVELERTLSVASRDPTYYGLDEAELSRRRELTRSVRDQVGDVRCAVEKRMRKSGILTHQKLRRNIHRSSQDNNDYISSDRHLLHVRQQDEELDDITANVQNIGGVGLTIRGELSRQESLNQQGDPDPNNPGLSLNEKATIAVMKVLSTSVLTMIAALSTYSSDTLAPLAKGRLAKEMLLISPYICVPIALIGAALSLCASESNGLADFASIAVLLVCLYGIGLGASAVMIISHTTRGPMVLWTYLLVITLFCAWGCFFAYPRCLKFIMRMIYWECFDGRRSTKPQRAAYTHPEISQDTDQKGFRKMLSNSFATCGRAFIPLNEDKTIDVLKAVSPTLLTAISVLSLWAAHTVAPQAYFSVALQRFLYMLPYFYLPLGVVTIALAVAASKSNGLASHASVLGLVLCAFGIALGACCGVVMLQFAPQLSALGAGVLIVALVIMWGWMLAYPKMLNFTIRKTLCLYCARRLKIVPLGRYDSSGCDSWTWSFSVLKVICRNTVLCPFMFLASCSRSVRAWWKTVRAHRARVDLDPEAGVEMIPMAVHVETQGGFPQGGVDWQWMNSMRRYRMRF